MAKSQDELTLSDEHRVQDRILTSVFETAESLGISETKTRELIASGDLLSVRIGRRVLVPRSAVQRYVERAMNGGAR